MDLDGRTVYHSAVTERPVAELATALRDHLATRHRAVTVSVLDHWPHRGAIERYFVHRYHRHLARVDGLADCFTFKDLTPILRDLHRLPPPGALSDADAALIMDDEPPPIEIAIVDFLAEQAEEQRRTTLRARVQAGMQAARAAGKHVGRPAGRVEAIEAFLEKPSSQRVITALGDGLSIRKAAAVAGVAPNTALKIKKILDKAHDQDSL